MLPVDSDASNDFVVLTAILLQTVLLVLPFVALCLVLSQYTLRLSLCLSIIGSVSIPLIMICDLYAYTWLSDRFLSSKVLALATDYRAQLAAHAPTQSVRSVVISLLSFLVVASATVWLSGRISLMKQLRYDATMYVAIAMLVTVSFGVFSLIMPKIENSMRMHSYRHPLCVFRVVKTRVFDDAPKIPEKYISSRKLAVHPSSIQKRRMQHRLASIRWSELGDHSPQFPDVVVIVIESLRPELVANSVMPRLSKLANEGVHCRNHYSSGNASPHGIFSLINGLEAIWFREPVRYSPLLNRLFRQSGYSLVFLRVTMTGDFSIWTDS